VIYFGFDIPNNLLYLDFNGHAVERMLMEEREFLENVSIAYIT